MEKSKLIIFGSGKCSTEVVNSLDQKVTNVIAYADNNEKKQGEYIEGIEIINPSEIKKLTYDYIIIASEYTNEIFTQLLEMGIHTDKIIPYFYEDIFKIIEEKYKIKAKKIFATQGPTKKIGLHVKNNSGSNTLALSKFIPEDIKNKYEIDIITDEDVESGDAVKANYDVICTTHLGGFSSFNTKIIELWHGFPIKKIGSRVGGFEMLKYNRISRNFKKMISYSELYSNIIKAAFPINEDKIEITGAPRNDFLLNYNNKIKDIWNEEVAGKKCIMYMPTYRRNNINIEEVEQSDRRFNNIFGFNSFEIDEFAQFLRKNNMVLITKLHPLERNNLDIIEYEKFDDVYKFLNEEDLNNNNIDLYEILGGIDILITDYSSVYIDMLLLDTKFIFINFDVESYSESRGFALEPYEDWTPGEKVQNITGLKLALVNEERESLKLQRMWIKKYMHKYCDAKSSERVWRIIEDVIRKN